jgi:PAS domain-containing protein
MLAIAEESGFVLEHLSIEITESALVVDLELARNNVLKLKAMGCRMALDDFGTGYSSLLHLQALPFDLLKVDRSFVSSMTTNRDSRKIVAAVVGLGHSLGLTTVGEGVETLEQERMLVALGCARGQGWLFGKPMPQDKVAELVASGPRMSATRLATEREMPFVPTLEALPHQRLAQLKAIYEGAPVGLCFVDRQLRYFSINQRLAAMNGRSISEHLGGTIAEILPWFFPMIEPFLIRALMGDTVLDLS